VKHIRLLAGFLICLAPALGSCRSEPRSALADSVRLQRSAWLGDAETWGLIGLPVRGGPIGYLRAISLESPTWAPPDVGKAARAWPGDDAIWIQFEAGGLTRYDYVTGHLLSFDEAPAASHGVAAEDERALLLGTESGELRLVGSAQTWSEKLTDPVQRLETAGDGRVVAVLGDATAGRLVVLKPPQTEPLGQHAVDGVLDIAVIGWANRVYYLASQASHPVLHSLILPDLAEADSFPLEEPARVLAATPSGHRLYVATNGSLQVLDRLRGRWVAPVELPQPVSALRFAENGATLLARTAEGDAAVVLRVGVDSVLGTVPTRWDRYLPVALPGGRLVAAEGDTLVLYSVPGLLEIARYPMEEPRIWMPVEWQPPRPRQDLTRGAESGKSAESQARRSEEGGEGAEETGMPPGYFAVVSAAQERVGVESLVEWLRSVGYPARIDQHEDATGAVWFRAVVGPYPERGAAESASRSLNARYGYKPWILTVEEPASREEAETDSVTRPEEPGTGAIDSRGEDGGDGLEG
jgi:hypothetical protein